MLPRRGICTACRVQLRVQRLPASPIQIQAQRQLSRSTAFTSQQGRRLLQSSGLPSPLVFSSFKAAAPVGLAQLAHSRRLQSTTAAAAADSATKVAETVSETASKWVDATLPATNEIGFLHAYGIDFGWGPSAVIQTIFEHIHVYGDLPFWGSICVTAALLRLAVVPLIMLSSDSAQRMAALQPRMEPITAKMKAAVAAQDQMAMARGRQEMSRLRTENGVKFRYMLSGPFIQIPLSFGLWRLTRSMADTQIPGLVDGGILWFQNLTLADPFFILPVMVACLQYQAVKTGVEASPDSPIMKNPGMKKLMLFGLPAMALPIIGWAPAAVQLNFTVTALVALGTNLVLRNASIRSALGLAPMYRKPAEPKAYSGTINISHRVVDHPDNIKAAKQARDKAEHLRKQRLPIHQRYGPAGIYQSFRETAGGVSKMVNDMMPGVSERQNKYLDKHARRKADEYEKRRQEEIERLRKSRKGKSP